MNSFSKQTSLDLKKGKRWRKIRTKPWISMAVLLIILSGCLFAEGFIPKDPTYMDMSSFSQPPGKEFYFGTDSMGRDIFSMIWYGGRTSLLIGILSTVIATFIAVVYGAFSGLSPRWLDTLLMRFTEIALSIPGLLLIVFFQAVLGGDNPLSIAIIIGLTSWMSMAKVVRIEVRQLCSSEYVLASQIMGGGFFHLLWKHLVPNFMASIMFMAVMNVRGAIVAESTLSFMGLGLPLEIITWGSMLSLAERALLSKAWWMILIPGSFLVTTLFCITNLGNYLRRRMNQKDNNL
ncbi:MAG: ABC transporter permease [Lachnospiraceae bacterium]